MDIHASIARAVRHRLGMVTMALLMAPLLWGAGGCSNQELIPASTPLPRNLMDLPTLMEFIKGNDRLWGTLSADCSVTIRSPQIAVRGYQVQFMRGHLQIRKPGMIKLEAEEGTQRISLVGNGQYYSVDLKAFADAYQGAYGDPLPATTRRILMMPDDLVMAWDVTGAFVGMAQVVKNLPRGSVIESIEMVSEPKPALRVRNSIAFDRILRRVTSMEKYEEHGAVRAQIVLMAFETVQGPEKKPVQVPSTVWVSYPVTATSITIRLRNIKINTDIPESSFALQP